MRFQRYFFTALVATLLWPLTLWLTDDPLLDLMLADSALAAYLLLSVFGGAIAGIWCVGAVSPWSSGETVLISITSTLTRTGIAAIAASIFAMSCLYLFQALGYDFSYLGVLFTWGESVLAAVWIATVVVDILKRQYKSRA
jgi:hypothetical protein